MATLTADQLADLRADIGDTAGTGFTEDELNRLYTRAVGDYDTTVALTIRQLLANAVKLTNYTQGSSSESRSQIFKHLQDQLAYWEAKSGTAGGTLTTGVIQLEIDDDGTGDSDYDLTNRITEWT